MKLSFQSMQETGHVTFCETVGFHLERQLINFFFLFGIAQQWLFFVLSSFLLNFLKRKKEKANVL